MDVDDPGTFSLRNRNFRRVSFSV